MTEADVKRAAQGDLDAIKQENISAGRSTERASVCGAQPKRFVHMLRNSLWSILPSLLMSKSSTRECTWKSLSAHSRINIWNSSSGSRSPLASVSRSWKQASMSWNLQRENDGFTT